MQMLLQMNQTERVLVSMATKVNSMHVYTCTNVPAGFHENVATNTFGRLTKDGKYKMYADFRFDFTAKVAGGRGVSGYLLDVFPASYCDNDEGNYPL